MRDRYLRVRLRRDDCDSAFICDGLPDSGAAICFVCNDGQGRGIPVQKRFEGLAIMGLRTSYVEPKRTSQIIYRGMNLTAATAA